MFTEEELYGLLEEAFEAGYDSAIDELEEAMNESESEEFDTDYPELFDENAHTRTLRGTGMHMMPKGIYGLFKASRKAHVKADKAWDDYEKEKDFNRGQNKYDKWDKLSDKAHKLSSKYVDTHYDTDEARKKHDRTWDSYMGRRPYKNAVARIMANKNIDASDSAYSRRNFVGKTKQDYDKM